MAQKDKIKWDKKYLETPSLMEHKEPSKKLVQLLDKVKGKKALDVACGTGRNSIYLATKGFYVDAIDISKVALDELNKKNFTNITSKIIDLDEYEVPKESYDIIIMTNFLDRTLITKLANSLKNEGILFIETYMEDKINEKSPSNPDFLLKKDELKSFFDNSFEILDYDEFINEDYELYRMKKQSIIVRKS